jgi:hypothetical protein
MRRLKRPTRRIRCVLSSVSDPVSARHHKRKSARIVPHSVISVQHDPVHAIVASGQQVRIAIAQRVRHISQLTTSCSADAQISDFQSSSTPHFYCPAGATFSHVAARSRHYPATPCGKVGKAIRRNKVRYSGQSVCAPCQPESKLILRHPSARAV